MKSLFCLSILLLAKVAMADSQFDTRAGAWDRSVAFEIDGNLAAAEKVIYQGWGSHPQNYWVLLRLAYLALLQQRPENACHRYQILRTMPESVDDPDVLRGHASALAATGWLRAKNGKTVEARSLFRKAISLDPTNPSASLGLQNVQPVPILVPELWSGITTHSLGLSHYQGTTAYAHLPIRITDFLILRGAFRYVYSQETTHGSPYRFSEPSRSHWHLDEEYIALAREASFLGLEVIGIRSKTSDRTPIWGSAGRLRIGSLWGFFLESAVLKTTGVVTHSQLRPMAFYSFGHHLVFQTGVRFTRDQYKNRFSTQAGISGYLRGLSLHLQGHLGKERWAFGMVGPSLMSLDIDTIYGGSVTLMGPIMKDLRFAIQAEGERLRLEGAHGAYFSFSAGIQLAMGEL